jgi:hypothetical protein
MGYLDSNSITVNAILTKKGREILAKKGQINITAFALSDDEIDYRLYDSAHPQGSAYYDVAIRNTPIFEPLTDESQMLKYKLVTLPPGTTTIPVIQLGMEAISVTSTYRGETIITPSTNPVANTTLGYTAILGNSEVGSIVGEGLDASVSSTVPSFVGDVSSQSTQTATGLRFRFIPNNSITETISTNLTIVGNESGGSKTIPVTVKAPTA